MDEEFHWEFSIPGEVCKIDPLGQMRWLKYKGQRIAFLGFDGKLVMEEDLAEYFTLVRKT